MPIPQPIESSVQGLVQVLSHTLADAGLLSGPRTSNSSRQIPKSLANTASTSAAVTVLVGADVDVGSGARVAVGATVGSDVGVASAVATCVGAAVDTAVGSDVGVAVGSGVGVASTVGICVGAAVDTAVGSDVGVVVGAGLASPPQAARSSAVRRPKTPRKRVVIGLILEPDIAFGILNPIECLPPEFICRAVWLHGA